MKIKRFICGNLAENGYVIYNREGGECFVIDPGAAAKQFITFIVEKMLIPKGILLTHMHNDHTGAVDAIATAFSCPVFMHAKDAAVYRGNVDTKIEGGEIFALEDEKIEVIHTPGHTHGSVCFMCAKSRVCFTGDTIFDTDLGRTDLSGGSETEMKRSITDVISRWENDITIYPGHDENANMKAVRRYNTEYLAIVRGEDR